MSPKKQPSELSIPILEFKKAAFVLRAINHTLRHQIMQLIHENKRMDVSTIYKTLQLEQSIVSQHLATLREAGFVQTKKEGRFIFYSINYSRVKLINQASEQLNRVVNK